MKLAKTEAGQRVLKDRSVALTPRQRAAFILCDGRHTAEEIVAQTASVGVTREDILHLLALDLVEQVGAEAAAKAVADKPAASAPAAAAPGAAGRSSQERYQQAYPIATRLTAALGLKGFRLNLAVEKAGTLEELREIAPKIREAVGDAAYAPLHAALNT
jgi:hypothetical protein